jgi:hypothetical protein
MNTTTSFRPIVSGVGIGTLECSLYASDRSDCPISIQWIDGQIKDPDAAKCGPDCHLIVAGLDPDSGHTVLYYRGCMSHIVSGIGIPTVQDKGRLLHPSTEGGTAGLFRAVFGQKLTLSALVGAIREVVGAERPIIASGQG